MKHINQFLSIAFIFLFYSPILSQTIWSGPVMTFEKPDGSDWELEENQDRITENVWITRADRKGIYNIVKENEFEGKGTDFGPSPKGTMWAFGTTNDGIDNLEFMTWVEAGVVHSSTSFSEPPSMIGHDMVLYLVDDDIYIDIKFISWSKRGLGGFSYERKTKINTQINESGLHANQKLIVMPNPATNYVQILNTNGHQIVDLLNHLGQKVQRIYINNDRIDINHLPQGVYFIATEDGEVVKFSKTNMSN